MGTRADVEEPPSPPILTPAPTIETSQQFSSPSLEGTDSDNADKQALHSLSASSVASSQNDLVEPNALQDTKSNLHTSAAAFVEGGVQDACEDSCSICLEPFCDSDPATVTSCKHDYHLQCILEWAQRSKDCPMCWRPLSFQDPNSQELFEAVEQERSPTWMRHSSDGFQFHQVPAFASYADFEERIMQHLAHQLARRGSLQNRIPSMHDDAFVHPSNQALLRTTRAILEQPMHEARQTYSQSADAAFHNHANNSGMGTRGMERPSSALETAEESQQRTAASSDITSLSETLKSRFLVASSKWKETFAKTTHGFKEKWRARGNSTTDFRARAQEVSADVVRQAIRRISPDSSGKDNDGPTTSSSSPGSGSEEGSSKGGARSRARCTSDNHLEGVAANGVTMQTPGEAV